MTVTRTFIQVPTHGIRWKKALLKTWNHRGGGVKEKMNQMTMGNAVSIRRVS